MNLESQNVSRTELTNELFGIFSSYFPLNFSIQRSKQFIQDTIDLLLKYEYSEYRISSLILTYKDSQWTFQDGNWEHIYAIVSKLATSKSYIELLKSIQSIKAMNKTENTIDMNISAEDILQTSNSRRPHHLSSSGYLNKEALQVHSNRNTQGISIHNTSYENLDDRMSDIRSRLSASTNNYFTTGVMKEPMCKIVEKYYPHLISEESLLQSLPYTLLGITSNELPIVGNMIIHIPKNLTNGDTQLLHDILEASLLFQYITYDLELQKEKEQSMLKKCLLKCIHNKLQEYKKFVNEEANGTRSLKELYFKLYWWIYEFRFYAYLLSIIDDRRGDEMLFLLCSFEKNCNKSAESFNWGADFLPELKNVYKTYVLDWLVKGELPKHPQDNEFFVQNIKSSKLSGQMHTLVDLESIVYQENQVPTFLFSLSSSLSRKYCATIYSIGKWILYLVQYCQEYKWVSEFSSEYSQKYSQCDFFEQPEVFVQLLEDQNQRLCCYIESLLKDKCHLLKVSGTMKNLMFMGNGKFIDLVIEEMEPFLYSDSRDMQGSILTKCLKVSIEKSSFRNMINKYDNNLVLNGIDARILELGHGSVGWDVFTLDYILPQQYQPIYQSTDKRNYLKLFNFLWRLKKADYIYVKEWKVNNWVVYNFKKLMGRGRPLIRDMTNKIFKLNCCCNLIRQFVNNIESYLKLFLIEPEFQRFMDAVSDTSPEDNGETLENGILLPRFDFQQNKYYKDLDELHNLHSSMLQKILDNLLITNKNPTKVGKITANFYSTSLVLIISTAIEFLELYAQINDVLYSTFLHFSTNSPGSSNSENLNKFNELLLKIVEKYGLFTKQKELLVQELQLDGSVEALELSRFLS